MLGYARNCPTVLKTDEPLSCRNQCKIGVKKSSLVIRCYCKCRKRDYQVSSKKGRNRHEFLLDLSLLNFTNIRYSSKLPRCASSSISSPGSVELDIMIKLRCDHILRYKNSSTSQSISKIVKFNPNNGTPD